MVTYTLKVVEIRQETADTCTICFKQPGLKKVKYLAGQYLTLIFRINGRRYLRPYSFSSCPMVDTTLDITIKRIPNGIVSNHVHDLVKVGDSIEVLQPMGDFTYEKESHTGNEVFLWGVGSGITPLISIAKDILANHSPKMVTLVYGNRSRETTIFTDIIQSLLEAYPERFKTFHFHSQISVVDQEPFLVQGRISSDSVEKIVKTSESLDNLHYICGPYGLKESVKLGLAACGVANRNIFSEDFELVRNPLDFEYVATQQLKLQFRQEIVSLEVTKGKSVLEAALDAGIELPYSCQTGNCSTCKGRLVTGKMKMIGLSVERADLLADEYLLCCSHPLSDDVSIEV
jgi:ring-1,2-phenylacetyl-CoA epoxidase subunit PaaE